jgi:hypothetical protein
MFEGREQRAMYKEGILKALQRIGPEYITGLFSAIATTVHDARSVGVGSPNPFP